MKKKKQQTTGQIDIQASNVWADFATVIWPQPAD